MRSETIADALLATPDAEGFRRLASFGTRPLGGDAARRVEVSGTPLLDGSELFTTRAISSFVSQRTIYLDLYIPRLCVELAATCREDQTCGLPGCVSPEVDPESLPVDPEAPLGPDPRPESGPCVGFTGDDPFALGSGSAEDPHRLCNGEQLARLAREPSGLSLAYRVERELDASSLSSPIGSSAAPFTGRFDGARRAITGLSLAPSDVPAGPIGLFGALAGDAVIERVRLVGRVESTSGPAGLLSGTAAAGVRILDVEVRGEVIGAGGATRVGGLVGQSGADIEDARVVLTGPVNGATDVGGLVGSQGGGTLRLARVESASSGGVGTWDIVATQRAGGLAGTADSSVIADSVTHVSVTGDVRVGGLVGNGTRLTVERSSASGDVEGTGSSGDCAYVGGLVGDLASSTIRQSFASGDSTTPTAAIGGLVGWMDGASMVEDSYATGDVDGGGVVVLGGGCSPVGGHAYAGGLVGVAIDSLIARSWASGTLVFGGLSRGGLVGLSRDTQLTACFASGFIDPEPDPRFRGGLVGQSLAVTSFDEAYWDVTRSGLSSCGGCPAANGIDTSADPSYFYRSTSAPLVSWDFSSTWQETADSYPTLRWE